MDRFFALLSAAIFAVMLSSVALFLMIVDARAATVDPTLTIDGPADAGGATPFTLHFTPSRSADSYDALSLALTVNGSPVLPILDRLDMVAGHVPFAYTLLPGSDLVTAVLKLTYRSGTLAPATITGCATGTVTCTEGFLPTSPPPTAESQTVTASLALSGAELPSLFAEPPAALPRNATLVALDLAAVPLGGSLPLLLTALAAGLALRARRG